MGEVEFEEEEGEDGGRSSAAAAVHVAVPREERNERENA